MVQVQSQQWRAILNPNDGITHYVVIDRSLTFRVRSSPLTRIHVNCIWTSQGYQTGSSNLCFLSLLFSLSLLLHVHNLVHSHNLNFPLAENICFAYLFKCTQHYSPASWGPLGKPLLPQCPCGLGGNHPSPRVRWEHCPEPKVRGFFIPVRSDCFGDRHVTHAWPFKVKVRKC